MIKIKNLRAYKKSLESVGIKENASEHNFRLQAKDNGLTVTKQGYADFMVLDGNNNVLAFVEVKPKRTSHLKKHQNIFKRFCEQNGHLFIKWCTKDDFPIDLINKEKEKRLAKMDGLSYKS